MFCTSGLRHGIITTKKTATLITTAAGNFKTYKNIVSISDKAFGLLLLQG
jgi:hypothetical protein